MRTGRVSAAFLLAALLIPWLACTALHVRQLAGGHLAWVGVYVAPDAAGGAPTVRDFWPGAGRDATGALAVGDRLLRIGDADLHGVGRLGFLARAYAAADARRDRRMPVTYARDGVVAQTTIAGVPVAYPWRMLPLTCTLVLTAALVLWRRPRLRLARAFFLLAVAYGLHWTFFFGGQPWQTTAWMLVFVAASSVMLPLILRAALLFPPECAPAGGRAPRWPWLFAVFGPISSSWVLGVPLSPAAGFHAVFAVNVAFIVTLLAVLTRNFRRAGPLGRRQLKWVLLGVWVGLLPVLLADVVAAVAPPLWWLHEVAVIAEILIPLSVLVAIMRANLFDVDRLITVTAAYSLLSVLALAAVLSAVPPLAGAVSAAGDFDPHSVRLGLSVLLAAGLVPAQRLLSARIERLLFRERHALRTGIEALLRELAAAPRPEALLTLVGERLDALLRPRTCVVYAPLGVDFEAVVAHGVGPGEAPPLPMDGAVVAALEAQPSPLDLGRGLAGPAPLEAERATLDGLQAEVVLPIRRGRTLAAVVCLGARRGGDVYTATDLALLAAVADKVSSELQRFDTADILRQERAMGAALRRYVPAPLAARLRRGQTIDGGECDVSVLFVDIRGYTTYSEQQAAGDVFSLVNRYTEAVSAVIQRRGGTVVEFLGDGLMAVFGAPEPLPDHARAAVQAGCEVVAAVRDLALDAGGGRPIAVGVGIASGPAFVGNIRTHDRFVYSAVGDVVNLAARIERLTRDLHAAVAIDARTHRTAGDSAARFRRHARVPIRGRAEPVDIYALPLAAA